jgi:heme/copper-type cytochrome/quinol oxidase subunit 4
MPGRVLYTAATMLKETLVFVCGILLTIVPFLGIPQSWRQYAVLAMGVLLIMVGYALRRAVYLSQLDRGDGERGNESFMETTEKLFE